MSQRVVFAAGFTKSQYLEAVQKDHKIQFVCDPCRADAGQLESTRYAKKPGQRTRAKGTRTTSRRLH